MNATNLFRQAFKAVLLIILVFFLLVPGSNPFDQIIDARASAGIAQELAAAVDAIYLPMILKPSMSPIQCGIPVDEQFTAGEIDTFYFDALAGDYVSITADRRIIGAYKLTLLSSTGVELGSDNSIVDEPELINQLIPLSGTYMIQLDGQKTAAGPYTLALYCAPAKMAASPTNLVYGSAQNNSLPTAGSQKFFRFTGEQGDTVTIAGDRRPNGVWKLRLFDSRGFQLAVDDSQSGAPEILNQQLPSTGIYLVVADGVASATGDFTLSLYGPPLKLGAGVTAFDIIYDVKYPGSLTYIGQERLYTFFGHSGDRVRILGTSLQPDGVYQLRLINPFGVQIAYQNTQIFPISLQVNLIDSGVYMIVIDGMEYYDPGSGSVVDASGTYDLTVDQID